MDHIQMTDRNPSELGFMKELTEEKLLAITGGGSVLAPIIFPGHIFLGLFGLDRFGSRFSLNSLLGQIKAVSNLEIIY